MIEHVQRYLNIMLNGLAIVKRATLLMVGFHTDGRRCAALCNAF